MKLELEVVPADDPALAEAGRRLMAELAGAAAVERTVNEDQVPRRDGGWIAIATLVGRPSGRRQARERIEPSLGTLRARAGADRQVTLRVGEVMLDGRASVDEVLDALATAGIRAKGART